MELLFDIFKILGMSVGIVLFTLILVSIIATPIRIRRKKKEEKKLLQELQQFANECIEELKKEKENKKKTTRKPRNTKKSE